MPGIVALPSNKTCCFGIEVVTGITWQGWEPGKEYTRNLTLKNVKTKTQKLKYSVPGTRFFSTLYPQPISLSAGTSFTLPVTFRPLEKKVYDDEIEFKTKDGIFKVPIKAVLPEFDIQIPELIDMKMCAVQDYVEAIFEMKNNSELQTPFHWDSEQPFLIEPNSGVIDPWTTLTLKATFRPKSAKVYHLSAVCNYGVEFSYSKTTTFEGIGKYPHLLVSSSGKASLDLDHDKSEAIVSFGDIPIGHMTEKWVELHNLSPVNAPFRIEHPAGPNRIDTVFACPQKNGIVPAMSAIRIPLTYTPHMVNLTSIDYFHVIAIGNLSKTVIKCVGSSVGPKVRLSSSVINYIQVDSGTSKTKTFEIINDSDVEATVQFQLDCKESVFKFSKTSFVISGKSSETVIVKFQPIHPINYYRQITCIVNNQGPLTLDLLGTCHTEQGKPAVLQNKHIDRYQTHKERGLSMFPPEQLNEMFKSGKLEVDKNGSLMYKEAEAMEPFCQPAQKIPPYDFFFNDGYHSDTVHAIPHVSTDTINMDFGNCTHELQYIEPKSICLTNHTKGKITVTWMGGPDHVFSVQPQTMDIPPLKSASFRISFKPSASNTFFGAELECFAFYKSLRDYRLVEDLTHSPPWCVTVTCTGQTFQAGNETFLPRYSLDSASLVFPAVNVNDATYRTVTLRNTGNNPILYNFEKDPNGIFSVKPSQGLLTDELQIFVIKCVPNTVKVFKNSMKLKLNDANKNDVDITLFGSAETPDVLLDSDGVMYFKPTCVGTNSRRQFSVRNVSRIPIRFEWHLTHEESKVLSVEPRCGIIQPNEIQPHLWTFTPREQSKMVLKPNLVVWGQGQSNKCSGGKKRKFPVRVIGEGLTGDIQADEQYVDFGNVVVGSSQTKSFTIFNNSNCNLDYKLHIEQNIEGPYPESQTKGDPVALILDETRGTLPARSKHTIHGIVKPLRRVFYQFTVSYELLTPEADEKISSEHHHLCHILATGVFPFLTVTDARCAGSAIGISKKQLWNLFNVDNLNVCLDADPNPMELMYSAITRQGHHRRPEVFTRDIVDFNFSAAPLHSEPCEVFLKFKNNGAVPTEWGFYFPCDLQMELEYWAETGEYDADELHEMKVMDNRLFSIEPKCGKLEPGEHTVVKFTYNHKMAGTDRLPVLLKLARGREIMLNFIGVTVEPDRKYLHFPSNKHTFAPVPIGEKNSPVQVYELYNGGALPVQYDVDQRPELELTRANFNHPVFECVNPIGKILPGRSAAIGWKFSPLEARTYTMNVPIRIHNGDCAVITFTGIGYDKRLMGDTMPIVDQTESNGVPTTQTVPLPGQLAFLSEERISFGNLPLFSCGRRVIYLSNRSPDHTISFKWHVTVGTDKEVVRVSPNCGVLKPSCSQQIQIKFLACTVPSFYDIDLVCEITDETEMDKYKEKLAAWFEEKERQKVEFTITENNIDADMIHDLNPEKRPPSGKLKALEEIEKAALEGNMPSYSTLPPIKRLTDDQAIALEKEKRKLQQEYYPKPKAAKPFLLHLGVTSRSHDVAEFQSNFPDDYEKYHIDRCLKEHAPKNESQKNETSEATVALTCSEAEADVISGVMSNILRSLLNDADFHGTVAEIPNEPLPYFQQLCSSTKDEYESPKPTPDHSKLASPEPDVELTLDAQPALDDVEPELANIKAADSEDVVPVTSPQPTVLPSPPSSALPPTDSDIKRSYEEEGKDQEKQVIRSSPEFVNLLEMVIENTLSNIMMEASNKEFNITARPRIIALLPKPGSASSTGSRKSTK
ncbi:cilia- and flagella-associated protein 65-like [Tubulanus polymorphus]|uniref:cilia- and flagella-associated protein 65-like n=1 Tax=Tubulanus polymorphus TaxID=672921 RepID=UPI003DA30738